MTQIKNPSSRGRAASVVIARRPALCPPSGQQAENRPDVIPPPPSRPLFPVNAPVPNGATPNDSPTAIPAKAGIQKPADTHLEDRYDEPLGLCYSTSRSPASPGLIQRTEHTQARPIEDVRIDHGRRHVRMAQQLLHSADIVVRLQQVRGERMSQRVAADALLNAAGRRGPGTAFCRALSCR